MSCSATKRFSRFIFYYHRITSLPPQSSAVNRRALMPTEKLLISVCIQTLENGPTLCDGAIQNALFTVILFYKRVHDILSFTRAPP